MAEVAASAPSPSKVPAKKASAKVKKEKAPANHPKYLEMAISALGSLKERSGSSRQAIQKYIVSNYSVGQDLKVVGTHLKSALKRGVDSGEIKHVKGTGASGSFKLNPDFKKKKEKKEKPKKPKVAKKAKASKPKKVKSESPAKAAKSPAKAKSPKKVTKPAKSIAKATKSPKKAPAAKKPASPAKPVAKKPKAPAKAKKVAAKK